MSLKSMPSSSYVRGAVVSLPFQVYCLKMLLKADLIAFSNPYFEFADGGPEDAQHRQPCEPSDDFGQSSSRPFEGRRCGVLCVGAYSPPISVAMLRSSQPPHQDPRTNPVLHAGA